MKVNLGCGSQVAPGWINVDYALGARLMKMPFVKAANRRLKLFNQDWSRDIYLHDLTKPLPWPDSAVDVAYSSHTLEHLTKDDGRRLLTECHRVMRTGGIIRIVVPDLQYLVNDYMNGEVQAEDFITGLGVMCAPCSSALKSRLSGLVSSPHKCMYDNLSLARILNEIGFNVSARGAFDSDIEDVRLVELAERTENAVIVEGRKR